MTTTVLPYNQDYYKDKDDATKHRERTLDKAIEQSRELLLSLQYPEGYWWAELESNATITAETVLLFKILGIADQYPLHKMENYLRRTQCAHGGWEIFHGDGGSLSFTIEGYMALRLLNVPKTDPALQKALAFITSRGGVLQSRMFTKICLALLGSYDWRSLPSLPPWLMLLPSWFPLSIYDTSSWARATLVPLIILFDRKPVFKVGADLCFDELYCEVKEKAGFRMLFEGGWRGKIFSGIDYAFKAMERMGLVPFRRWGLKEAEKWLFKRREETGDFSGIFPPMFYTILWMNKMMGFEIADPPLARALLALKRFSIETKDEYIVQSCISPIWDTALTVRSLVESGLEPDHPALQRAGEWLLQCQTTMNGDWAYKIPSACSVGGGWCFQFCNRWYPDIDDSACVVMALNSLKLRDEEGKYGALCRGVQWILSLQSRRGGWGAYDKDNDKEWLNSTPFADLKALIDPNTVDVTARVLEMVGRLKGEGTTRAQATATAARMPAEAIARGLSYMREEQEKEGCWYGRWGVNYIYGTSGALIALALAAPESTHREEIRRGAKWLVKVQNKLGKATDVYTGTVAAALRRLGRRAQEVDEPQDGGWGETCFSYDEPALKGMCEASTASQTAWALQGLLASGDALGEYEEEAIERGVHYLVSTQRADGSWYEAQFTGGGFPCHFYLRYHLYAQHFPLSALSRYRARLQAGKLRRPLARSEM